MSMRMVLLVDPVGRNVVQPPGLKLIFMPWVRCPPCASESPRIVSPGRISACMAAALAWSRPSAAGRWRARHRRAPWLAYAGELLGHVDVLAAAVVAPARIALGVLVGQHRALRLRARRAGAKFSLAIISSVPRWRSSSRREHLGDLRDRPRRAGRSVSPPATVGPRRLHSPASRAGPGAASSRLCGSGRGSTVAQADDSYVSGAAHARGGAGDPPRTTTLRVIPRRVAAPGALITFTGDHHRLPSTQEDAARG